MNSWEILKKELTKKSTPGTFGRSIDVNLASDLFVRLMDRFTDSEESKKSFNEDKEVFEAICNKNGIEELRKAGVIS